MHYYCKHTALSWYHVLSLFSICAFFSFSCLKYLCAGFTCMCMPWTPATLKYNGARFRQKSHSYSVDRTPIFFICSVKCLMNMGTLKRLEYIISIFWINCFRGIALCYSSNVRSMNISFAMVCCFLLLSDTNPSKALLASNRLWRKNPLETLTAPGQIWEEVFKIWNIFLARCK